MQSFWVNILKMMQILLCLKIDAKYSKPGAAFSTVKSFFLLPSFLKYSETFKVPWSF